MWPHFPGRKQSAVRPAKRRLGSRSLLLSESLEPRLALSVAPLVVTEIMYNPPPTSAAESAAGFTRSDFDYIELQNIGATPLVLTNFEFVAGVTFRFGATTLAPGDYTVIVADANAFAMRYGTAGINVAGAFDGSLANGGEALTLVNDARIEVFTFEYNPDWFPSSDGDGYSLVVVDPNADASQWSLATGWQASPTTLGSPGRSDGPSDSTPPTPPTSLTANLNTTTGRVDLTWQPSIDPDTGVIEYRIYRNGLQVGVSATTAFADNAPANATYSYTVRAVNGGYTQSDASNIASVTLPYIGETPAFAAGQAIGPIITSGRETSGLAASHKHDEVFYIHNDGEQNRFVAINANGQVLGTITLSGVTTIDTEDIAVGPGPQAGLSYVYLGDIGDNDANRANIRVIRVPEPTLTATGGSGQSQSIGTNLSDVIYFTFPGGPVDAEAMFVDPITGDLYIFSKDTGTTRVFRAAAASLIDGATVQLTHVANVAFSRPSAADISPLGGEIIVRNEDGARLYRRGEGQTIVQALTSPPITVPVIGTPTEPNGEAIAFDGNGNNYYTVSEGRDPILYYFHRTSRSPESETPGLEGDLNADGLVGLGDLMILQRNFGAIGATTAQGDLDGNGTVDRADVARLAGLFGSTTTNPANSPAAILASASVSADAATTTDTDGKAATLRAVSRRAAVATRTSSRSALSRIDSSIVNPRAIDAAFASADDTANASTPRRLSRTARSVGR